MEKRFIKQAVRAHRVEARADRKEARLHGRAVNAALHGNMGKAARLEVRAGNQAVRADRAHTRGHAATAAMLCHAVGSCTHSCGGPSCTCPGRVTVITPPAASCVRTPYPVGVSVPPQSYPTVQAAGWSPGVHAAVQPGYPTPQPGYPPPGYTPPQPGYTPPQPGYTPPQPGYTPPGYPSPY